MNVNTFVKQQPSRIKAFLKQIRQLAWFELLENWFSLGIKLFWITLLLIFGIYLRKEYKKDIFYIQDFQVPPVWVEQGYSGEVVKQAIIDDIDNITNSIYSNEKSNLGPNEDGTEVLSDISIEGFNLKAITKSILAILGKKNKNISGYITISDSTQTVAIQVTDQITQPLSVKRSEPAQKLIHKTTLEIMKIKSPGTLIAYYQIKKDTTMVQNVYRYLSKHRALINDYLFYDLSVLVSLFEGRYDKAFIWADSVQKKFPNDRLAFFDKARIYGKLIYYGKADSVTTQKYKNLYVENLLKTKEPGRTAKVESDIGKSASIYLALFHYNERDFKSFINAVETASIEQSLDAAQNNALAYAYVSQKDYTKAEEAIRRTLFLANDVGDYWDSLAEIYSLQNEDSLAVVNLTVALNCPQKSPAVSVEAYQKDARWDRLRKREDFQKLMKRN